MVKARTTQTLIGGVRQADELAVSHDSQSRNQPRRQLRHRRPSVATRLRLDLKIANVTQLVERILDTEVKPRQLVECSRHPPPCGRRRYRTSTSGCRRRIDGQDGRLPPPGQVRELLPAQFSVFTRMYVPSKLHHTGWTCGVPSLMSVARDTTIGRSRSSR